MATNSATTTKVVTGAVRLSYVHLFEAYLAPGASDPKFSCVILIPKNTKDGQETHKKILAAQQAAAENGKAKFGGKVPTNLKTTLHDGDTEADLDKNPEYAGHWYMSVSAKTRPGIVDQNVQPILDSSEVYSGVWAKVSMNAFAYNTQGNRGISFGLNHVQKVKDGEYLGGRSSATDDFAPLTADDGSDLDSDLL